MSSWFVRVCYTLFVLFFIARFSNNIHFPLLGSHVECQYSLMTFGIPVSAMQVTSEGDLKREKHLEWLAGLQKQEEANAANNSEPEITVILPARNDVLFGRGKTIQDHPGNLRLQHLIENNRSRYDQLGKWEKTVLSSAIVAEIQDVNGRFLKLNNGVWVLVDSENAREKVSHA
jgi:hypothetical protein